MNERKDIKLKLCRRWRRNDGAIAVSNKHHVILDNWIRLSNEPFKKIANVERSYEKQGEDEGRFLVQAQFLPEVKFKQIELITTGDIQTPMGNDWLMLKAQRIYK